MNKSIQKDKLKNMASYIKCANKLITDELEIENLFISKFCIVGNKIGKLANSVLFKWYLLNTSSITLSVFKSPVEESEILKLIAAFDEGSEIE